MNSHKDRLETIAGKNSSLPRQNNRNTSTYQSRRSNSHLIDNEHRVHRSKSEHTYSDEDRRSPVYLNVRDSKVNENGSESQLYYEDRRKINTKSMDRLPFNNQMRQTLKSNGAKPYITMNNGNIIHKSSSLQALKASDPNPVLQKSSIQQEHHDKAVQRYFRGVTFGKARRPCRIATAMFVLFGCCFITGLVIIGLTYLYQNIMPSLDIGEAVGPCFLAGSFIFLGVGIKFIYDAHKISRKQRRQIGYKSYNKNYVGVRDKIHNPQKASEKLVSGTISHKALTRKPYKIQTLHNHDQTLAKSTQSRIYERTEKSSNV